MGFAFGLFRRIIDFLMYAKNAIMVPSRSRPPSVHHVLFLCTCCSLFIALFCNFSHFYSSYHLFTSSAGRFSWSPLVVHVSLLVNTLDLLIVLKLDFELAYGDLALMRRLDIITLDLAPSAFLTFQVTLTDVTYSYSSH